MYYVHAECGHDKKSEIAESCKDVGKETCALIPLIYKQITAPSLCVACFREEEARIDAEYYTRTEWIRCKMAEHEAAQAERQIRGRAQGTVDIYIAMLERESIREKESRDLRIRTFRSEQDVWADG